MKKILCLIVALFFMSFGQAFAALYNFKYTSNDFIYIVGTLTTSAAVNGGGMYDVLNASGVINSVSVTENITLIGSPTDQPGHSFSPFGVFGYDNQLSPSSAPMLTNWGLLFLNQAGDTEINIFWNTAATNDYSYIRWSSPGGYTANVKGIFTVSSVPIPPTVWLLGSGLIGLVGLRRRFTAFLKK